MHKRLNLKKPKTYNEKLSWLKLYDQQPDYWRMVDKLEMKVFVNETVKDAYTIRTLVVCKLHVLSKTELA